MLSTSNLLSQMDLLEAIKIENLVQSKVDFDSPVLYYLNSYLLKTPEKELLKESFVNPEKLPIHDRFIYNCILEHYGLSAKDEKDLILSEVYSAVYLKEYNDDLEKANELERLFHKMKKNNIEQEATHLLKVLYKLHQDKPLEAVYKHLYKKYAEMQKMNQKAIQHFISLNTKLNALLENKIDIPNYKALILEYKHIRKLNEEYANPYMTALLSLSKLILVSICKQDQLLKQCNKSIVDLLAECKASLDVLAFGVEKFYFTNIYEQIELYVSSFYIDKETVANVKQRCLSANNFGFPKSIIETIEEKNIDNKNRKSRKISLRVDQKINHLVTTSISSLSIPRDSLLVRTNL